MRSISRNFLSATIAAIALGPIGPAVAADSDIASALRERLAQSETVNLARIPSLSVQMRRLYAERGFQPIWTGSAEADMRAHIAQTVLSEADAQGLDSADYRMRTSAGSDNADFEASMTRAVLAYAHDVTIGRVQPNAVFRDAGLPERNFDPVPGLSAALNNGTLAEYFAALPPPHPEYRRLVAMLADYRGLASKGPWPTIPGALEVKPGANDPRIEILKPRLAAEDPVFASLPAPSDADLVNAVKRYQTRNGFTPDGRIGRATLDMLNVPVQERVNQIIANMERWRWLPRAFEARYIAVNVPDKTLALVEDGKTVLTSRVIVGKPSTPTPIVRADAIAVTANPPWNVPSSIAAKEILPKLKKNPNYLVSENMVLLNGPPGDRQGTSIDWRKLTASSFPYRVRQVPGSWNALGRVKLELPNKFDVYLHDTPGKTLFAREDRALSHGCIRVQEVMPLAVAALGGTEDARDNLNAAIAGGVTQQLPLDRRLPVYVLYWTAITSADGGAGFRRDLYGRDRRLIAALEN